MKVTPVKRRFGRYKPGDVFEMPDRSARVFVRVGQLREVHDVVTPVITPAPEPVYPPAPESVVEHATDEVAESTPAAEAEQEISPRTGLPKRQYRRRDMTAEG